MCHFTFLYNRTAGCDVSATREKAKLNISLCMFIIFSHNEFFYAAVMFAFSVLMQRLTYLPVRLVKLCHQKEASFFKDKKASVTKPLNLLANICLCATA